MGKVGKYTSPMDGMGNAEIPKWLVKVMRKKVDFIHFNSSSH